MCIGSWSSSARACNGVCSCRPTSSSFVPGSSEPAVLKAYARTPGSGIELPVVPGPRGNFGEPITLVRCTPAEQQITQILEQHTLVAEVRVTQHRVVDLARIDGVDAVFHDR